MKPVLGNDLKNVSNKEGYSVQVIFHCGRQVLILFQQKKGEPFNVEEDHIATVSADEETQGFVDLHKGIVESLEVESVLWTWRRKGCPRTSADHRGH